MATYEPLQQGLTTHGHEEPNAIPSETLSGVDDTTSGFLPPKPLLSNKKSQRQRSWMYCGGTLSMVFLVLLPLLLYSPGVVSDSIGSGRRAVDVCSPELNFPNFFEPDMLMGSFTLGQAKAIDLGWNTVIGRGGQGLMALGSYSVVMQGVTRIAESAPVTYDLFIAVVFHPTSATSILPLAKNLLTLRGWRPKFAMGWLLYSLALTGSMSTLFDASSGYKISNGLMYYPGDSLNGTYYAPTATLPAVFHYSRNQPDSIRYNCLPSAIYQWGFVSGWMLIVFPLWSIWVFGMFVLWVDAQHNSKLTRKGWRGGEWRAILDLSGAINQQLGPNSTGYSSTEVEGFLKKRPPVMYDIQEDKNGLHSVRLTSQET